MDDSYRAFWSKREEIKARHRAELEAELAPERKALQRDIFKVQADYGYTVGQVAETLGNTRNFVYLIRNDKPLIETDPEKRKEKGLTTRIRTPQAGLAKRKQATVATTANELSNALEAESVSNWHYDINPTERLVTITVGDGGTLTYAYTVDQYENIVDIPSDWLDMNLSKSEKDFYRKIIQEIQSNAIQPPEIAIG
jgi:hypothetical protein